MCRQRGGGHLEHFLESAKNDNVTLRDSKLGEKIMPKLYFVRNKVHLITSNISRFIRVFDMLLFCVTLYFSNSAASSQVQSLKKIRTQIFSAISLSLWRNSFFTTFGMTERSEISTIFLDTEISFSSILRFTI